MNYHFDRKAFTDIISEVSEQLGLKAYFVEKDYWITLILRRLSYSQYADSVVFKGGTSLSKGFKLINRFSEDVDIAVLSTAKVSGNMLKTLIRTVEKEISKDLEELVVKGITSKGSKFRRSVFHYPSIQKFKLADNLSDTVTIEVNSFANPLPFTNVSIQSMIGEFLQDIGQDDIIKKYGLEPFNINILDKKQTLIEKLVSLIRFSYAKDPVASLSRKIRHFYDLYYLVNDPECRAFVASDDFIAGLRDVLNHDRSQFDEPADWGRRKLQDSLLINEFDLIWTQLRIVYKKEISVLAFTEIPDEKNVKECFKELISGISKTGLSL